MSAHSRLLGCAQRKTHRADGDCLPASATTCLLALQPQLSPNSTRNAAAKAPGWRSVWRSAGPATLPANPCACCLIIKRAAYHHAVAGAWGLQPGMARAGRQRGPLASAVSARPAAARGTAFARHRRWRHLARRLRQGPPPAGAAQGAVGAGGAAGRQEATAEGGPRRLRLGAALAAASWRLWRGHPSRPACPGTGNSPATPVPQTRHVDRQWQRQRQRRRQLRRQRRSRWGRQPGARGPWPGPPPASVSLDTAPGGGGGTAAALRPHPQPLRGSRRRRHGCHLRRTAGRRLPGKKGRYQPQCKGRLC